MSVFVKGQPSANPAGRPKGAKSKYTMAGIVERMDRMIELQSSFLNSVQRGDVPPFNSVEECLGAIEFLSEGIQSGHFEREAAQAHIDRLRAFIEAHAASNFCGWQNGRML
jgi:hypothetical protein